MNHDDLRTEVRTRRRWVAFICSFFVAQAVLWTVALQFVSNDPSHAVVADYDERALSWDQSQARQAASDALGWSAQLEVALTTQETGLRKVRLHLLDADRRAVDAASVQVTMFHHATAARPMQVQLEPEGPGVYSADTPLARSGKWSFQVEALRGEDAFMHRESRVVQVR